MRFVRNDLYTVFLLPGRKKTIGVSACLDAPPDYLMTKPSSVLRPLWERTALPCSRKDDLIEQPCCECRQILSRIPALEISTNGQYKPTYSTKTFHYLSAVDECFDDKASFLKCSGPREFSKTNRRDNSESCCRLEIIDARRGYRLRIIRCWPD